MGTISDLFEERTSNPLLVLNKCATKRQFTNGFPTIKSFAEIILTQPSLIEFCTIIVARCMTSISYNTYNYSAVHVLSSRFMLTANNALQSFKS